MFYFWKVDNQKLFLLDSMALIFRAYFAFSKNPRVTTYGFNTSAVFGFTNTLLDLIKKENPTHLAAAFDTSEPTERHIEYEAYKANRETMPEDLSANMPYIFKVLEAMNIPILVKPGYEADDIVGTIAKQASAKGYKTFMVTMDKDFGQLVNQNSFIYKPARMGNDFEILDEKRICERWGISNTQQVIDILGLMGDSVDNIPGVPGVGEKTATKLIQEYGSMENLFQNTHQLKGKLKENLETYKEQGLLSKKLATINCNVPIEWPADDFIIKPYNEEKIRALFEELEFRTMTKRMFNEEIKIGKTPTPSAAPLDLFSSAVASTSIEKISIEIEILETNYNNSENTPHEYTLVDTEEKMKELATFLATFKEVCFDTETTSLEAINAELVGISFAVEAHKAFYIPVPENREKAQQIVDIFKPLWANAEIEKVAQNIKYDMMVLDKYGVEINGKIKDTMLMHYIIEAEQKHGMDDLSRQYLNYDPISITTLIGKKGKEQLNFRSVEIEKAKEYGAEDADITLMLKNKFVPELEAKEVTEVYEKVEAPLVKVLADMELTGVRIDRNFLANYSKELEIEAKETENKIYEMAGAKFNLSSPKQVGEILFDLLKLDAKAKKTKTGQYKTDEEVLQNLALQGHEIAKFMVDFRQIQKLKSTYVDALPQLIHPKTGRVHTSFNQALVATGRLSSNNPNLQNIPIRTEMGKEVRKAFIPKDGNKIISADYSQIELRIIAAVSKDKNMIKDFEDGLDIHSATAARVFGVPLSEVDKDMRRKSKMVNFGIIYGISAFGLSQRLEIPRKEAQDIISEYFNQYGNVKKYMDETINEARENGFVSTWMGRRRYIRDITSANHTVRGYAERNAINAPIQGSAADMIKMAMIAMYDNLRKEQLHSKMILQVHDELLFDVLPNEVDQMKELVIQTMQNAMPIGIPVIVEAGVGNNWLEAH